MGMRKWLIVPGLVGVVATTAAAITNINFGLFRDHHLDAHSVDLGARVPAAGAAGSRGFCRRGAARRVGRRFAAAALGHPGGRLISVLADSEGIADEPAPSAVNLPD
jgi:hypothetical protein